MATRDWHLAKGNTALSMLGLPMVAPYTVGARWAAALRGMDQARRTAYARANPWWTAYQFEYDYAGRTTGRFTGAATIERKYGCPAEWHPDYPFEDPMSR